MHDAAEPILQVENLHTWFFTDAGVVRAVDGVSFSLHPGETLGIVGESGSGKSVTAKSIIRLLDEPARIVEGTISFRGRDMVHLSDEELRQIRGAEIAMVFQDPMTSLNPVLRIARQLIETMTAHRRFAVKAARERAVALLGRMGMATPERAVNGWPHQFSGGMRQRVMLAMGFANEPALLIADEPTTALDVTIQAQILDLLRELNADLGTAVILISHDLGVIADVCSRVLVMYAGEVVEEGAPDALLSDPRHPYTWALLHAAPRLDQANDGDRRLTTIEGQPPDPHDWPTGCRFRARCPFAMAQCVEHPELKAVGTDRAARCWVTQRGETLPPPRHARAATDTRAVAERQPLLQVRALAKHFILPRDSFLEPHRVLRAVDGVDFDVFPGETVGLVGESGCGKSTLARVVMRLTEPTEGSIVFDGQDISHMSQSEIRPLRRRMQMIFQDPYGSLNPRMTVGEILRGPLRLHGLVQAGGARERVRELLDLVGLPPTAAARFPRRVLRRPAPAHLDRACACGRAGLRHRRRADFRARRQHSGADHQPDDRAAGTARADLPVHRARSCGRAAYLRPHRGAVSRPRGGDRTLARAVRAAAASLHQLADFGGAGPASGDWPAAHRIAGRGAQCGQPTLRLPLPHAVSGRRAALRRAHTGAGRIGARPLRRVPFSGCGDDGLAGRETIGTVVGSPLRAIPTANAGGRHVCHRTRQRLYLRLSRHL